VKVRELIPLEMPVGLRHLRRLTVAGDISPSTLFVAIVGARAATPATLRNARRLARAVVEAGGVVVSGGADGTDDAAHEGAIDAGGRTWSVLGCGASTFTPKGRDARFHRIVDSGGAILWPFAFDRKSAPQNFLSRNRVIMALARTAIVVQAGDDSGSMNAARHARELGKEIFVVPGLGEAFAGSWQLVDEGARVLRSEAELASRLRTDAFDGDAQLVLNTLGSRGKHPDEIALETGLSTPAVTTALLTLALGDVVVEGSAGLFQRK
jgi:DNA processing protein